VVSGSHVKPALLKLKSAGMKCHRERKPRRRKIEGLILYLSTVS